MVVCSKSCKVLAKSMIFRAFSRNEERLATFSLKIHRNAKTSKFVRKVAKIWPNWWFFVLFHGTSSFLQHFAAMFIETSKHGSFSESCFWENRWFLVLFHERRTFCNFFLKVHQKEKDMVALFQKLQSFGQIDDFSCCFTKWGTFCNFFPKSWSKCQNMVVCSKSCKFWPNRWVFAFSRNGPLFAEKFIEMPKHGSLLEKLKFWPNRWAFSRNEALFASFCWKVHRNA